MVENMICNMSFFDPAHTLSSTSHVFYREFSEVGNGWIVIGKAASAIRDLDSVILQHNGGESRAQVNLIKKIVPGKHLSGKKLTFSVETRVLQATVDGKGGTLGVINANGYSGGKFYEYIDFNHAEWKRVFLNFTCQGASKFEGLTVCIRAAVTEKSSATVEFRNPCIYFSDGTAVVESHIVDTGTLSLPDRTCNAFYSALKRRDQFNEKLQTLMRGFRIAEDILSDEEGTHYMLLNKHGGDIFRLLQYAALLRSYFSEDQPYHMPEECGATLPKGMYIKKMIVITSSSGAMLCKLFSSIDDVIILSEQDRYDLGVYSKSALCVHSNLHRDEEGLNGDRIGTRYKKEIFHTESYNWYWNLPGKIPNRAQLIRESKCIASESIEAAKEILKQHQALPEKTVILCPYAKSSSMLPEECWTSVANDLKKKDYYLFTNAFGEKERAISGTQRLEVPLDVVIALNSLGCLIASVQSGLADTVHRMELKTCNINIHVLLLPYDRELVIGKKILIPTDRKANTFHLSLEEHEFSRFPELLMKQIEKIEAERGRS